MPATESLYFDIALDVLITILSLSLLLCFVRLYLGPNVPNRTAAFDAIALHSVGIIVLFAIRSSSTSLLDVAIVTAALGFLGTTMLAQYLERAAGRGWKIGDEPVFRATAVSARVAAEIDAEDRGKESAGPEKTDPASATLQAADVNPTQEASAGGNPGHQAGSPRESEKRTP